VTSTTSTAFFPQSVVQDSAALNEAHAVEAAVVAATMTTMAVVAATMTTMAVVAATQAGAVMWAATCQSAGAAANRRSKSATRTLLAWAPCVLENASQTVL
jgi:hypothetical protein